MTAICARPGATPFRIRYEMARSENNESQQRFTAATTASQSEHVEKRIVLAGERRLRQVFDRRARTHRPGAAGFGRQGSRDGIRHVARHRDCA